jgi:peptidoglycan/LPS O-acetylase OafA/YrhL
MENSSYKKFAVMLLVSFVLMYAIMFLNVEQPDHIYLSMTRLYMTVLMICAMAILMLVMMPMMYPDKKINLGIIVGSIALFVLAFVGVHKQVGVGDVQYMKGMIPHHSIAIMTSKNAHIKDARVRKLADGIIKTQVKEITEMKALIDSLQK